MSFKRRQKPSTVHHFPHGPPPPAEAQTAQRADRFSIKQIDPWTASLTSSGIPSFDDILGGGVALGTVSTILDPNLHSAYGDLILKHFVSQGLLSQHTIIFVDLSTSDFLSTSPWIRTEPDAKKTSSIPESAHSILHSDDSVTIAWRYRHLKQFSTTVETEQDLDFCHPLDLSTQIPTQILQSFKESGLLLHVAADPSIADHLNYVIQELIRLLGSTGYVDHHYRICVRDLGSFDWGDCSGHEILRFLHQLRGLTRRWPNACAMVKPAFQWVSETLAGDDAWGQKLAWLSDSCVAFASIAGNPSLHASLPQHHGMVVTHNLQKCNAFISPSDYHSRLRGLAPFGGGTSETLHLDVEGGVGERRTTRLESPTLAPSLNHQPVEGYQIEEARPRMPIELDQARSSSPGDVDNSSQTNLKSKKKGVAFRVEHPDLYDF